MPVWWRTKYLGGVFASLLMGGWHAEINAATEGQRIYEEGRTQETTTLTGTVQGDVPFNAKHLVCASCHRRSGLGSSEGGIVVPPITGDILFKPRAIKRRELYAARTEGQQTRPAYTEESLARALREGVDPAGRRLDPLMPRYALNDAELASLSDYLRSLSSDGAPGVTAQRIHFATITSDQVAEESEMALLSLLQAFLVAKNGQTRGETERADRTPWHKDNIYPTYRRWQLHHWRLIGPPSSWQQQLEAYYREQPVFAILSGDVGTSWAPVHAFSEEHGVPALLPYTDLPGTEGYYTIYPSEGMALLGKAVASDLAQANSEDPAGSMPKRIVQLFSASGSGAAGAATFSEQWSGRTAVTAIDLDTTPADELIRQLAELHPDTVLLWLERDRAAPALAQPLAHPLENLYLISNGHTLPSPDQAPLFQARRVLATYPHVLPEAAETRLRPLRHWLKARHIPLSEPGLMANAYLTASVTGEALMHMRGNFSRHYFIEKLEHIFNRTTFSGFYPQLSLAPGQRFVAKGCYVVELDVRGQATRHRWWTP